jgi:glutathione S-transferase
MMLKIFGVPISVHTRKVIVTAIEKQLDYENDPVIPFTPPPGWNELSPTGKIPALTDGEVTLCDSSVICAYLERSRPDHPVYPPDTREYVTALWFEEYADGTMFREVVHGLFFNKVIRPNILKQNSNQAEIDSILNEARPKVFAYLERSLSGEYLAGNRFSVADIAVVSNLVNYHYLGFGIDARKHPKLASYFAKQLRHPSIASALAKEQGVAAGMGLDRGFLASHAAA